VPKVSAIPPQNKKTKGGGRKKRKKSGGEKEEGRLRGGKWQKHKEKSSTLGRDFENIWGGSGAFRGSTIMRKCQTGKNSNAGDGSEARPTLNQPIKREETACADKGGSVVWVATGARGVGKKRHHQGRDPVEKTQRGKRQGS